jgi:hypothetical protein
MSKDFHKNVYFFSSKNRLIILIYFHKIDDHILVL